MPTDQAADKLDLLILFRTGDYGQQQDHMFHSACDELMATMIESDCKDKKVGLAVTTVGGWTFTGQSTYHYLRAISEKCELSTYGLTTVLSAGMYLLLGANHRYAVKNCSFVFHKPVVQPVMQLLPGGKQQPFIHPDAPGRIAIENKELERVIATFKKVESVNVFSVFDDSQARDWGVVEDVLDALPQANVVRLVTGKPRIF